MAKVSNTALIRVWDIWTRLFHWSFAAAIIFLLVSGETGFLFFDWHRKVGEFVLLLLLFRVLWGFVGSTNASLVSLITHPRLAVTHLLDLLRGKVHQTRGHNAAGGWAVLVMLLLVSFQAISGLFIADEDELIEGVFYGALGSELSERLLHLHHLNAEFLMILVSVHVAMIFFYLLRAKQNLIKPMITGKMQWVSADSPPQIKWRSAWLGLIVFMICFVVLGWRLGWLG